MDGTCVPLKRNYGDASSVSKECMEIAIGITRGGRRQVLDFRSVPQEGEGNWSDFPESLKMRDIGNPEFFVADGLSGMPKAIAKACEDCDRNARPAEFTLELNDKGKDSMGFEISERQRLYGLQITQSSCNSHSLRAVLLPTILLNHRTTPKSVPCDF